MAVNTRSFSAIVSTALAAVQGAAGALVDASVGSITLAYMQACAGIALWLQGALLQVAALTRLSTSTGADVDSYLADFGFERDPAVAATGTVTFSRFTPTAQALISPGAIVQTGDGTQQFTVIADTEQSAWNAMLAAYVIAANVSSCDATVRAAAAGSDGNVAAGVVTVLGQSIPGVDSVTNAAPFASGADADSDADARASFRDDLENVREGTPGACKAAAEGIQAGVTCQIVENQTLSGTTQAGYFYAIVDDGTGSPSSDLLSKAYAAIDAVRAEGTTFGVFAPNVVTATVVMTVTVGAAFTPTTVANDVSAALMAYINSLTTGASLPFTRLSQIAYDASAGVANVTGVTLNSGTADLVATGQQLIRAATPTVHTA